MSSGGSIPYHLRQNKAIERNLFVDLLSRVGRYSNISDFQYIGFGGPFLEDFKHLHASLRISDMVSLEMDSNVFSRQGFNKPISCIDLRKSSSAEFLSDFEFADDKNRIVWFDYATPEIDQQLQEVQRLVEKLGHGDIFKVTVNASPSALGFADAKGDEMLSLRASSIKIKLGDYGSECVTRDQVTTKKYPMLLLKALINASKYGVSGDKSLVVQGLTAFTYSDGQQMLTFTGILLNECELDDFFSKTRLRSWPFFNEGLDCKSISVPAFSTKERVHIESLLPGATPKQIIEEFQYFVGANRAAGEKEIDNFITFYRLFPWYSRVVI